MKKEFMTMDGNTAAAMASYNFTEVAAIYPITPSSDMAEHVDAWAANGRTNIFGQRVAVREMQSEGGAAGTVHGSLQGGALTTTYTASQGLLLMIPNMYKIAGELLPAVFHVSARSLASNTLSIFGDHQDVMATRQTGFALLASSCVQECMDLGTVAHLSAIKSRLPFLHFFDGFRTSHEIQKIELLDQEVLKGLVDMDAIRAFKDNALNPDHPVLRGTTTNPDIFFQMRESVNPFYETVPQTVQHYMDELGKHTGRNYKLYQYYGDPNAEDIIVAMGSGCDTIKETIDYLNAKGGKYGLVEIHLYRPFAADMFVDAFPKTMKRVTVLDRTKEPGAIGEPLFLDVQSAFYSKGITVPVFNGRFGLASKEFIPDHVVAVFENMKSAKPMRGFTVGIKDDVTHLSLPESKEHIDPLPDGTISCKFWGLGSDGTVSANKNAIKIIGDHTDKYAQAYFSYDAKKSGGITVSHLRFSDKPIRAPYLINNADFIACHNQTYVDKYDLIAGIKEGGTFLLNCTWDANELEEKLPTALKKQIIDKKVNFYTINAAGIAQELGLGHRINMIMQSAFFALNKVIPLEQAVASLKDAVVKSYGKQGQKVIDTNHAAIDKGATAMVKITLKSEKGAEWPAVPSAAPDFIKSVAFPMNAQKGDDLPVSAWKDREDGSFPTGVTQWEKREISLTVPQWNKDACIQCNQCSMVCPHSVLRPTLMNAEDAKGAPAGYEVAEVRGSELKYHMGISVMDCTGCELCINTCPKKNEALKMVEYAPIRENAIAQWKFDENRESIVPENSSQTIKNAQFNRPLLEFSGACAGCGETAYAKLVTQLFGHRMMITASAGCSTVWGGSAPSVSFTKNNKGHGPSWGFSLFEDNAEYGLGMLLGVKAERGRIKTLGEQLLAETSDANLKAALTAWLENFDDGEKTRDRADALAAALQSEAAKGGLAKQLLERKDYFIKRSHWVFGGDGWAYDIGYGGLDHVLASGENINVLVFDTELYSNTGGQSSKATPTAAIAKFDAAGKNIGKKDLGRMAMSYGYVYVAQVAMGADKNQVLRAIREAEAYNGPSLIICYAPCINHGIKGGLGNSGEHVKQAVDCGYWSLYRYNPDLRDEGKNPFTLDSKTTTANLDAFMETEVRFSALKQQFPERAKVLYAKAQKDAQRRLDEYVRLAKD